MQSLLLVCATLMASASAATASLLPLRTLDNPRIVGEHLDFYYDPDFDEFFASGSSTGALIDGSTTLVTGIFAQINAEILASGGIGPFGGSGVVTNFGTFSGAGTLAAFGSRFGAGTDVLQFLFDVDGSRVQALATITGEFGATPFFQGADFFEATGAELDIGIAAPVPLPAGGLLLVTALGAMALRRPV